MVCSAVQKPYIHTCICIYICTYVYIRIHIKHININIHIHTRTHTHTHTHIHMRSPPMIRIRLCCSIINTIFCMQLCLARNRKHCNLQYFLLFGLYSNCISCVLVLSLRAQKLKMDSAFKILCLPYAYTYTYIPMHTHIHIHIHMH